MTNLLLPPVQSPTLSGISWYDLSSVDVGIIVSLPFLDLLHVGYCTIFCSYFLPKLGSCDLSCGRTKKFAYDNFHIFVQTSGSLYGALIGSIVAFSVADIIGWFFSTVFI